MLKGSSVPILLVARCMKSPAHKIAPTQDKYISSNNGLNFLFTGQMILRKGVNYLLKAWVKHTQLYPDDKLVLVGGGVFLERWKKEYRKYSSIIFEGTVAYDEIYK